MVPASSVDGSTDVSSTPPRKASSGTELRLHPLWFLILAVVAGVAFVVISQPIFPIFRVPDELWIGEPTLEEAAAQLAAGRKARALNATIGMGLFALLMGGLLGIGEAAAGRFEAGSSVRLAVGVLLGTALGCLGGLLGQLLLERLQLVESLVPIGRTTIAHACTLGIFGLGVGTAVGLVARGPRRLWTCVGGGGVSGLLVGLVFPGLCALVMYHVETEITVIPSGLIGGRSERGGLALWTGLSVAGIGIILPLVTRGKTSVAPASEKLGE